MSTEELYRLCLQGIAFLSVCALALIGWLWLQRRAELDRVSRETAKIVKQRRIRRKDNYADL